MRATIRVFADAHQHCPSQPPEPEMLTTPFFQSCPLFFAVPSLTCDREKEGIYAAIRSAG
jgi:hypothetical protein